MYKIGIDIGGTKIEGILLDEENNLVYKKRISNEHQNGYDFIVQSIVDLISDLRTKTTKKTTVGLGMPGIISPKLEIIKECSIQCMKGHSFKKDIEEILKQEIWIENDANCFALAESVLGAGKSFDSVFGITLGTGIGGGFCINGKLYRSKRNVVGEWGHMILYPEGRTCYCGKNGCNQETIRKTRKRIFY